MKIFGYYISKRNLQAELREQQEKARRDAKEADQYKGAWQASRDELAKVKSELNKTITQMDAARMTHERQIQALHAERERIEEQAKTTETTYQRIIKEQHDKISEIETRRVIAEGRRDELAEENRKLRDELGSVEISIEADTAKEYIAELEKENGELKHRIAELETNCDALIDENSEYGAEIDRLRALVDSLQEDELAIRCLSLEDRIAELEEWRANYRAKRTASQRRNRERKRQLKNQ